MTDTPRTGGCQCGAVRYRIEGALIDPALCHCRMCQKASGNLFMAMVGSLLEHFEITRGEPAWFRSSDAFERGFCGHCGTPLFFKKIDGKGIGVTIGSLDEPATVRPVAAYGTQSRMPWIAEVCALDGTSTEAEYADNRDLIGMIDKTNRQHPDHDTDQWPPQGRESESGA
jgi:hypothetical protein